MSSVAATVDAPRARSEAAFRSFIFEVWFRVLLFRYKRVCRVGEAYDYMKFWEIAERFFWVAFLMDFYC